MLSSLPKTHSWFTVSRRHYSRTDWTNTLIIKASLNVMKMLLKHLVLLYTLNSSFVLPASSSVATLTSPLHLPLYLTFLPPLHPPSSPFPSPFISLPFPLSFISLLFSLHLPSLPPSSPFPPSFISLPYPLHLPSLPSFHFPSLPP